MKNSDCMDVDLAFEANITIEEFMAMVSTQREQKKNHAKKTTREKKKERRSLTPFFSPMSVISVEEGEYKNGDVLYIVEKNEEEDR